MGCRGRLAKQGAATHVTSMFYFTASALITKGEPILEWQFGRMGAAAAATAATAGRAAAGAVTRAAAVTAGAAVTDAY